MWNWKFAYGGPHSSEKNFSCGVALQFRNVHLYNMSHTVVINGLKYNVKKITYSPRCCYVGYIFFDVWCTSQTGGWYEYCTFNEIIVPCTFI